MTDWRAYPIVGKHHATVNGKDAFAIAWLSPITGQTIHVELFPATRNATKRARRAIDHYRIRHFDTVKFPWTRVLFGTGQWPKVAVTGHKPNSQRAISV